MAIHAPIVAFVFRPGGIAKANVYTNWATLVGKLNGVEGRKILEFDDSAQTCIVPAGTWNMRDVVWAGYGPRPGATRSLVVIQQGAVLEELRMIGGQITIDNQADTISPISDFVDDVAGASSGRNHVQIGMRDDSGNTQFLNSGTAPLFDLGNPGPGGARTVFFFCQNTLLNIRYLQTPQDKNPLITHGGSVRLTINFIGQNQTGDKLVKPPATARFGALSSSTQIAADNINVDGNDFAPVTRIQRRVQPRPPRPPARSVAELGQINLPNVLLRCDGNGTDGSGFTVLFPKIVGGFMFSMQERIPLYTGGQEIIVAEIAGGANLKVTASPGDTIDGSTAPVELEGRQARTFASDGLNNWITIVGD